MASAQDLGGYLAQHGYVRIPMNKLSSGHETVSVTINGVEGRFLLDSGANGTVVHSDSLARFGLQRPEGEGAVSSGAGGEFTYHRHDITTFQVADLPLDLSEVISLDLGSVISGLEALTQVKIDGVVGQDVLTRFEGVIDVRSQSLFLRPENASPQVDPLD